MSAQSTPLLAIDGLTAGYGSVDVLHELSLPPLGAGQVTALLGPNGSGKSTLLKALAGLVRLRAGHARLDRVDLGAMDFAARARHLAYLPQSLPAAVHLRVFESVLVAARASEADGRRRTWTPSNGCCSGSASAIWRCATWTRCPEAKNNWWASPRPGAAPARAAGRAAIGARPELPIPRDAAAETGNRRTWLDHPDRAA